MLWYKAWKSGRIIWWVKKRLFILTINLWNIYNCKPSYNNLDILDGWDFCNNFIWLSGMRNLFTTKLQICYQGLFLMHLSFLSITQSCMKVILYNMLKMNILKMFMQLWVKEIMLKSWIIMFITNCCIILESYVFHRVKELMSSGKPMLLLLMVTLV